MVICGVNLTKLLTEVSVPSGLIQAADSPRAFCENNARHNEIVQLGVANIGKPPLSNMWGICSAIVNAGTYLGATPYLVYIATVYTYHHPNDIAQENSYT